MTSDYISGRLSDFKATHNPLFLVKAVAMTIRQGRAYELAYCLCLGLFTRPSRVRPNAPEIPQSLLDSCRSWWLGGDLRSRAELVRCFDGPYAIHSLPADFAGTRLESIVCTPDFLIIGEYGDRAKRLALVTKGSCAISDHYEDDPLVDHIHAVYKLRSSGAIFVTTGDTSKALDLWSLREDRLEFLRRLKSRTAGYTAIAEAGGHCYFGTDFSSRPNYIETLGGQKYFFPQKAYRMYVLSFRQYQDRYLLSINRRISALGGGSTLSIFDTAQKDFVFCEHLRR